MPRTRPRRSSSARPDSWRTSSNRARAPSGSRSSRRTALSRRIPSATIRACAPSCRSRSMRRSSAARSSRASARVSVSHSTRRASSARCGAARSRRVQRACRRRTDGASRRPAAVRTRPRTSAATMVVVLRTGMNAYQLPSSSSRHTKGWTSAPNTPYTTRADGTATSAPPTRGSSHAQARSRQNPSAARTARAPAVRGRGSGGPVRSPDHPSARARARSAHRRSPAAAGGSIRWPRPTGSSSNTPTTPAPTTGTAAASRPASWQRPRAVRPRANAVRGRVITELMSCAG